MGTLTTYGQVEISGHLWLWFDLGDKSVSNAPIATPWVDLLKATFDGIHAWAFVTTVDDQSLTVVCSVLRGRNQSAAELNVDVHVAGPVFAQILNRLVLERR